MKYTFLILVCLLLVGCQVGDQSAVQIVEEQNEPTAAEEPLLGGDVDEHGCIGSAGYSWCDPKQKCLRVWEEECPDI